MTERSNTRQPDPWQPVIERWICDRKFVTVGEILRICFEKPQEDSSQAVKNRVARCLKALKWERYQQRLDKRTREWRYRRSPVSPAEVEEW